MHPDDYAEDALAMANRALTMGDDEDGGFTDDEEAEQLAHVRQRHRRVDPRSLILQVVPSDVERRVVERAEMRYLWQSHIGQ